MEQLKGIVPVLVTPFTSDGEIDQGGLERLLAFLEEQPIGGLWVLGTGSEDMNLSWRKRLKVAEVVSGCVGDRIPVILGAAFFALDDILDFIDATRHLNASSYHVMPYHPLLSADRLEWLYTRIANHAHKPLWMYTSANWSQQLPLSTLARLKRHENIAGIKFSSSVSTAVHGVLSLADKDFQAVTAVAAQTFQCFVMGSKAHVSSLASALPESMLPIYDRVISGDYEGALAEQSRLSSFLQALPKGIKRDNFLAAGEEKYILSLRGICESHVSPYYRDLTVAEQRSIDAALGEFGYLQDQAPMKALRRAS